MLKQEYRTYLQYRGYLLGQLARASNDVTNRASPCRTHEGPINTLTVALETHDRSHRYQEGRISALTIALEEHDRLFRAGQPA
jgi:hypothetical protein